MTQVPPSTQEERENNHSASVLGQSGRQGGGGGGGDGNLPRDAGSQLKQQGSWVASSFRPKALGVCGGKEPLEKLCNRVSLMSGRDEF